MSETIKGFCLQGKEKIYPNSDNVTSNTAVVDLEISELKEGEILAKTLYIQVYVVLIIVLPLVKPISIGYNDLE